MKYLRKGHAGVLQHFDQLFVGSVLPKTPKGKKRKRQLKRERKEEMILYI